MTSTAVGGMGRSLLSVLRTSVWYISEFRRTQTAFHKIVESLPSKTVASFQLFTCRRSHNNCITIFVNK